MSTQDLIFKKQMQINSLLSKSAKAEFIFARTLTRLRNEINSLKQNLEL